MKKQLIGCALFLALLLCLCACGEAPPEDGFFDIAAESFAVFPHRWGLVELEGGRWRYTAGQTDVEAWASENASDDARLLDYENWGRSFFLDSARAQLERSFSSFEDAELRARLCDYFSEANVNYFMGTPSAAPEGILAEQLSEMNGRTSAYLSLITGLDDSLSAEGSIG